MLKSHYVDGFDEGDLRIVDDLWPSGASSTDRQVNNWTTRARGHVGWDARTQTDIGLDPRLHRD